MENTQQGAAVHTHSCCGEHALQAPRAALRASQAGVPRPLPHPLTCRAAAAAPLLRLLAAAAAVLAALALPKRSAQQRKVVFPEVAALVHHLRASEGGSREGESRAAAARMASSGGRQVRRAVQLRPAGVGELDRMPGLEAPPQLPAPLPWPNTAAAVRSPCTHHARPDMLCCRGSRPPRGSCAPSLPPLPRQASPHPRAPPSLPPRRPLRTRYSPEPPAG